MSLTLIFEASSFALASSSFGRTQHGTPSSSLCPAKLQRSRTLSPLGERQSVEMGQRYKDDHFDAIFYPDRHVRDSAESPTGYKSAEIGFGPSSPVAMKGKHWPIIRDARLRECNYGDLTQKPGEIIDAEKPQRISTPFPHGESYTQTTARMKSFLDDLPATLKLRGINKKNPRVMVIGHRATQYGIEHVLNGVPLEKLVTMKFKWQPGWVYNF